jgi:hypothetical protein
MNRTIKVIERHMVLASSRIVHQSNSNKPTVNRPAAPQNECGGTQWKLWLRLPRFRSPTIAVAKC